MKRDFSLLSGRHFDLPVCGATVQDRLNHTRAQILARQIVNTTGSWASATEQGRDWRRLTKSIHLVMPAVPADEAAMEREIENCLKR